MGWALLSHLTDKDSAAQGGRCESCVSGKRRLVGGWRPAWDGVASPLTLTAAAGMRVWTGSSLPARGATGSSWGHDARFCLSTS